MHFNQDKEYSKSINRRCCQVPMIWENLLNKISIEKWLHFQYFWNRHTWKPGLTRALQKMTAGLGGSWGQSMGHGAAAPPPPVHPASSVHATQPIIPPGSVNEYQLNGWGLKDLRNCGDATWILAAMCGSVGILKFCQVQPRSASFIPANVPSKVVLD